jgi:hypothetical protein
MSWPPAALELPLIEDRQEERELEALTLSVLSRCCTLKRDQRWLRYLSDGTAVLVVAISFQTLQLSPKNVSAQLKFITFLLGTG